MHCLCKSISTSGSTSALSPINLNAYIASRILGIQRLLLLCRETSYVATSRSSDIGLPSSTELIPLHARLGLNSLRTSKTSLAAHYSFNSTRGLKSTPKKNALKSSSPSSSSCTNLKRGKAKASKDFPAKSEGSSKPFQPQKGSFSKQKQIEARKPSKQLQALSKRAEYSSNLSRTRNKSCVTNERVRAKAKDSSKQGQKGSAVNISAEQEDSDEDIVYFDDEDSLDDEDLDFDDDDDDDEEFEEGEEIFDDDFVEESAAADDLVNEDDAFVDGMLDEEGEGTDEVMIGDGGDGGGVKISTTAWGEKALSIAKAVLHEFGDNFSLYGFKTSFENKVFVRLDKHSDRYGSPSIIEIESFSSIYGKRLEEAGQAGDFPESIALEVSSPGAERVVQVPNQLLRFKGLPMFVRYEETTENENKTSPVVKDSILEIESIEAAVEKSVWKLANVRANREQAGKGKKRALTRKQKEWRLELPLSKLRLVRLYMDV